jgi:3D (Asp-Asp-Asp) domain-containing protein
LIRELLIVACVTATIYHADPAQCNEDYLTTASLKTIEDPYKPERWIAVSRDLEADGFTMGSKVIVSGAGEMDGEWTIEDRMNKRWRNKIDFLVSKKRRFGRWDNVTIKLKIDTK